MAAFIALLWLVAPIAFSVGYQRGSVPFRRDEFGLAMLLVALLGPALLIGAGVYLLAQAQRISEAARRLESSVAQRTEALSALADRLGDTLAVAEPAAETESAPESAAQAAADFWGGAGARASSWEVLTPGPEPEATATAADEAAASPEARERELERPAAHEAAEDAQPVLAATSLSESEWEAAIRAATGGSPVPRAVPPPPAPAAAREDQALTLKLNRLGLHPATVVPDSRLRQLAEPLERGDLEAAERLLARLAPAAVRTLAQRLRSDDALRAEAAAYESSFAARLSEAAPVAANVADLVSSEGGRLYLLLRAAHGEDRGGEPPARDVAHAPPPN